MRNTVFYLSDSGSVVDLYGIPAVSRLETANDSCLTSPLAQLFCKAWDLTFLYGDQKTSG